ncbi:MAG: RICIN domain-containing protein [Acutalibacteraceae bacterium]
MNKKILSLLLTFILVFTSLTFSIPITKSNADTVANADEVLYGDVDGDGRVSIIDATLIQKYCAGTISLTLDQKKRADVDFNGKITENDATLIQKYLADIITEFEKPLYGDANGDGKVSVDDVITIQKHLASYNVYINKTASDVDFDGKIDIVDATYIQRYLAGYFESFEGYTIKYDPNGGSGCMEYQNVGMFDTVNLSLNQFRRTGYAFAGWKVKYNNSYIKNSYGSDIVFSDGQDVAQLVNKLNSLGIEELRVKRSSIITLSAFWRKPNSSNIRLGEYLGIYEFTPRHASDKCITIAGGNTANYTNAQLYSNNNYAYQHFMLRSTGVRNCYYIYDTNSNKVLEAASSNITNGTNVRLNELTGFFDQLWCLEDAGDGYYYISSYLNDDYVFDIYGSSTSNGANLRLFEKRGYSRQQFKLNNTFDLNKAYRITPRSSSEVCIDVQEAETDKGTNVWLYTYNCVPKQQYNFSLQSDGSYVIYSCLSDKVLTVEGDKAQNCANIALCAFENKDSQKWFLQIASNGYYYFASALDTSYVLDIYGGYTGNGTNIILFKKHGGNNQQFAIQEADFALIAEGTYTLQLPNGKYLDEFDQISDSGNYPCKFAFELQNEQYDISCSNNYLFYDPKIINEHITFSSEKSDISKWTIESAGNGYYYIYSTIEREKLSYIHEIDDITITSYDCFKLIACKGRSNNQSSSKKLGSWKLVCQ